MHVGRTTDARYSPLWHPPSTRQGIGETSCLDRDDEGQSAPRWIALAAERPEYVLQYLGRYTHRVAISNHRLISFTDGQVTFRWRDSAHNNEQKVMSLSLDEFLRRFLLHWLPKGFVRIRHFGFLANRRRGHSPATLPASPRSGSAANPTRSIHGQGNQTALALSQVWRADGGHRATNCGSDPAPFSTLSRRCRPMKLQVQAPSLGAPHHRQMLRTLLAPKPAVRSLPQLKTPVLPHANYHPTSPGLRLCRLQYLFPKPLS